MCLWGRRSAPSKGLLLVRQIHVPAGPAAKTADLVNDTKANPCSCGASTSIHGSSGWRPGKSMLLWGQLKLLYCSYGRYRQIHAPVGPALFRRYAVSSSGTWITADWAPGPPCSVPWSSRRAGKASCRCYGGCVRLCGNLGSCGTTLPVALLFRQSRRVGGCPGRAVRPLGVSLVWLSRDFYCTARQIGVCGGECVPLGGFI